jgi:molybdopterin converting factor small subunit
LRTHAAGEGRLELDVAGPATLRDVLDAVAATSPAVGRRIRDEAGALRRHVNVFVGPDNARDLGGLDAPVAEGAEVSVLAAVSGGDR